MQTWNLLTRTQNITFEQSTWKLTMIWILGFIFRYFVLLPGRIVIFVVGVRVLIYLNFKFANTKTNENR